MLTHDEIASPFDVHAVQPLPLQAMPLLSDSNHEIIRLVNDLISKARCSLLVSLSMLQDVTQVMIATGVQKHCDDEIVYCSSSILNSRLD